MKTKIETEQQADIQEQLDALQKQIVCAASTGHSFRVSEATDEQADMAAATMKTLNVAIWLKECEEVRA